VVVVGVLGVVLVLIVCGNNSNDSGMSGGIKVVVKGKIGVILFDIKFFVCWELLDCLMLEKVFKDVGVDVVIDNV